jgi:hypothetical protein
MARFTALAVGNGGRGNPAPAVQLYQHASTILIIHTLAASAHVEPGLILRLDLSFSCGFLSVIQGFGFVVLNQATAATDFVGRAPAFRRIVTRSK